MQSDLQCNKDFRRIVENCAAVTGALAFLALLSWVSGTSKVGAFGREYVPMAPSTALAMIVLSLGIFLHCRRPSKPASREVAFFAIFAVIVLSLFVIAQFLFDFELPVEQWLTSTKVRVGDVPFGRMSPLAAATFLLVAFAFLLEMPPFNKRRLYREMASVLALATLVISLIVCLSYAAGAPLLYGDAIIPMALLTGISFALLSVAILLASGPDIWLFSLLRACSIAPPPLSSPWFMRRDPVVAFLFLFVFMGAGSFFVLRHQIANSRRTVQNELSAIADLKANQISAWYKERQREAELVFKTPMILSHARRFLSDSTQTRAGQELLSWMEAEKTLGYYKMLVLFDAQGSPQLSTSTNVSIPNALNGKEFQMALRAKEVVAADLHYDTRSVAMGQEDIHLCIWIPIGIKPEADAPAEGVLMMQIDPRQVLYPLIQSWPIPSRTAETLLIRLEGDDVVYLNDLRHMKNTALSLRLPLDRQGNLPAAMAVTGKTGIFEGLDYRSVPVLACTHSIPGTPWFMVAKVDQEEIYAPLKKYVWTTGIILIILGLASALGLGLLERRRDEQWLRKQLATERERQALAERIVHLNKQANDIILLMDQNWNILEANDRALLSYGYSLEELQRMPVWELRAPQARADFDRHAFNVDTQDGVILETIQQRKDGSTFPVESSVRSIEIGGIRYHQAIVRDITERKRAEQDREKIEERLRQAQKLEAIGTLAGGIAHDFNNILGAILGFTEMVLLDIPQGAPARQDLEQVIKASLRARDLVSQILAFSRHGNTQERRPVEMGPIIKEALKLLRATLPATIELRQEIVGDLRQVLADATQIHQVVVNLCTNAAHAMREAGGVLEVRLSDVELDADTAVQYPGLKPGWYSRLTVSDSGHGMEQSILERIFDPYFTTKGVGEGSGLGLAVVQGIVQRHQGSITAYSEPGKGATFHVLLPRIENSRETTIERLGPVPKGTEHILFVDDEEALAALGSKMLERLGYRVTAQTSAFQAIHLFRAQPDAFDLIITDYTMPHLTGVDLAKEMMLIRSDIPIILCTGFSAGITKEKAQDAGIREFVMKPLSMSNIAAVIRQVLARE